MMQQLTVVNHNDDDGSYKIICILLNTMLMKNINHDDEDSIGYNIILVSLTSILILIDDRHRACTAIFYTVRCKCGSLESMGYVHHTLVRNPASSTISRDDDL